VIPSLADGYYDIVYIDAMKREYLEYLLACIPKMTPDALIVIDDVEKFRDKMEDLYDWLEDNDSIMVIQGSDIVLR
jgi:predicted O-methyltransferase YrrM